MEQVKESKPSAFHIELWKYRGEKDSLIPLLQAAQAYYSYVPESAIYSISSITGISSSDIYGVVTFYRQFRLTPPGKHLIRVCDGTACHVNSSTMIINAIRDLLEIEPDETTDDGLFTFQTVACLGCCSLAPVMTVDNETYGRLNPSKIEKILGKYRQ